MNASGLIARLLRRTGVDPIILGIVAFFLGHMLIRLFGTSNFSVDETMTAIHTQTFQFYYSWRNPPLFDWLYLWVSRLIGSNLLTMQLLKTALLTGGGVFLFLAIKPLFRYRAALVCAIASYGATAFYGWEILQLYSHTNVLIFAVGFTFWGFMRLVRSGRTLDYFLLGIGLGLGILSKYLFAIFFAALLIAALLSATYRQAVLSWRIVWTLATGLAVISPFLYGLSDAIDLVFSSVGTRVAAGEGGPNFASVVYFIAVTAEFWLPFAAILWVCLVRWPAAAEAGSEKSVATAAGLSDGDFYRFVRDATLIMIAVILAAVFFLGTRITAGHYLVPVLSLLPVAIFAGIERRQALPIQALDNYLRGALGFIVGIAVLRFLFFLFVSPPFCVPRCVLFVDYTPVVEMLETADGKLNVILSDDVHLASNLLPRVPNSRIILADDAGRRDGRNSDPAERNCRFVWFRSYRGGKDRSLVVALERALRRPPLGSELAAIGPIEYVKAEWQTKLLWDWGPDTMIGIARIESASPMCASGRLPGAPATR